MMLFCSKEIRPSLNSSEALLSRPETLPALGLGTSNHKQTFLYLLVTEFGCIFYNSDGKTDVLSEII